MYIHININDDDKDSGCSGCTAAVWVTKAHTLLKCAASSLPEDTAEGARSAWSATAVSVGTRPSRMS